MSGSLTPTLLEQVVRLGASLPFAQAVQQTEAFRRVGISRSTVRRHTLKAGAAAVRQIEEEVERLETERPAPPPGPDRLVVSVDGAMVPLRGGEWAEVRTLAVGCMEDGEDGEERTPNDAPPSVPPASTRDWSYFSRLTDAESFGRLAMWETDRRGVTTARRVAAITDGAEWI